ncbi:hypothetical protein AWE51_13530 [Aquimarina aggregata]|uniref:Lipocalin-like domain-containing protein n=1 Tax=Aquimarina aggregata TaxID=1642818 RepID=A0A162XG20_9FLAO|nr:hypothetical protein [Aquimarina aggregata]KZS38614.1 hypothetical protein AWE51_13530 [Aquimarina aggregata]
MKKINLILLASLFLGVISCSSDDENPNSNPNQVDPNPIEDMVLEANSVSQGLTVDGANRITGNAPTPTGNIPFAIDETNQSGFLNSGFDITFDAPQNFAGAYLQVRSNDGTIASDYLDIPSTAIRATRSPINLMKSTKMMDDEIAIDVDFDASIPPGKFCYLICIYDTEGNISNPVEVCVVVEAWGGNSNLIGTWNYTKQISNGVTIPVGSINFCEGPETITCNNQETIEVPESEGWCYASTEILLTLKEDGTYTLTDLSFQKQNFLFSESQSGCSIVNEPYIDEFGSKETSTGFWAYNEEGSELNLIEFENKTIYFEDNTEDNYIEDTGSLFYFSGITVLDGNNLIIKGTDFDFNVTTEYHFTK